MAEQLDTSLPEAMPLMCELVDGPRKGIRYRVAEAPRVLFPRMTDRGVVADVYRLAQRDGVWIYEYIETEAH